MAGPDIFLSYNREDAARAKHFADGFASEELEVWWDVALRSGEAYDEVTEDALHNARAVVVLWSPRSVVSRWVRSEATIADRNKTLLPVMIEPCRRPIMFELTQTAELSHWEGDTRDRAWQEFIEDVRNFVGREAAAPAQTAAPVKAARAARQGIVVLPFTNMSGDPEQEYFADGITEDIITDLSKISALSVISRNSAFTFKGKHVDIVEVATRLNVDHVLEGSVRKAGNRVRVTAQLIDGMNNDHVWAERFDRDLDDIFALQDELSKAIVDALKVKLVPAEKKAIASRGTDNLEAYDLYLRGRGLFNSIIPQNNEKSAAVFRKAVELDPDFGLAWAALSDALSQMTIYVIGDRTELEREMEEAYQKAVALAPDSQRINVARGMRAQRNRDWEALEACDEAWDSKADDGWGFFSLARLVLGDASQAAERQLELRRLDPLSIGISFVLQFILDCAGRLDEAEAEFERSKELDGARIMVNWRALERALVRGDYARAKDLYVNDWIDQTEYQPYREDLIAAFDAPKSARKILNTAVDDPSCQDGARLTAIAAWASHYGDNDLVLSALQRAFVGKGGFLLGELWHPIFAEARRDPRFKAIVRELGLDAHWRKTGNWGDFARPLGDGDFEIIA